MAGQAIQEIGAAGAQVKQHVDSLAMASIEYGRLKEKAATLRAYLPVAHALASRDPQLWHTMPAVVVRHLLTGAMWWAQGEASDPDVEWPDTLCQTTTFASYHHLRVPQLLLWALKGLDEAEDRLNRRALASRSGSPQAVVPVRLVPPPGG